MIFVAEGAPPVVRFVAEACDLKVDLGVKGKSGILRSMATRATFLQNRQHCIRFIYTPKHTSWLNQIGELREQIY